MWCRHEARRGAPVQRTVPAVASPPVDLEILKSKTRVYRSRVAPAVRADDIARKQAAFLKGIAVDGTMLSGCKAAKVEPRTVYGWRETDETFVLRERQARELMVDKLEAEAIRRGARGVQQPVFQAGKHVGFKTEYSDALLVLVLRANRPERYREKVDLNVPSVIKAIAGISPADVL